MARVEKTIEVDVPVRTAYNQWTQFEEFPRFMEGVEEVRQTDDRHLHWRATIGGRAKEWDAEIREQVPDQKIIWRATDGAENAGMVKFDSLGSDKTRVHLEMSYDPEGFMEHVGDALGFVTRRVQGDLERFKELIEARGIESGSWRGEIHNESVPGGHTRGSLDAGEPGRSRGDQLRTGGAALGGSYTGFESANAADEPIVRGTDESGMAYGSGAGYGDTGTSGRPGAQYGAGLGSAGYDTGLAEETMTGYGNESGMPAGDTGGGDTGGGYTGGGTRSDVGDYGGTGTGERYGGGAGSIGEGMGGTGHDRGGAGYQGSVHADELGGGPGSQSGYTGDTFQGRSGTPADTGGEGLSPGERLERLGTSAQLEDEGDDREGGTRGEHVRG